MSTPLSLEPTSPKTPTIRPMNLEETLKLAAVINAHSTPRASQKPTGNVKDDPDHRLAVFATMKGFGRPDNSVSVSPGVTSDDDETHTAIPNPNRKNWSGEVVPTPLSLIKPASIRGFQPSHLVVLAGKEVGIFTFHAANNPPFGNGFVHWEDAWDYYARNYYLDNVKIVPALGSPYNPIQVPSTAPTPVKRSVNKPVDKSVAVPKVVHFDSKNPKRKAYDVNAHAGPSSATRIKPSKGKKRARTEPLPDGEEGKASSSEDVVVVSD